MSAEVLSTYAPWELRSLLEDLGYSDPVIEGSLLRMEAAGRLTAPLVDPRAPRTLSLASLRTPPVEQFVLGQMVPLGKASVMFGPTGAGKSALLAQLAFAVAGGQATLFGLPVEAHGPVLIVSAEDTFADWERKAAAVQRGTADSDVESAVDNVRILPLPEGEARLTETVTVRDGDTVRRVHRPTDLRDRIVDAARGAVLVIVETASRLVEDEDNASFSALQSALGHIAAKTGAAVVVTHHATKVASRKRDSSIESARGGGALVANARNVLSLFPAEHAEAKRYADRFAPSDLFMLRHGKSTSSTKQRDAVVLVRGGTKFGAVFLMPDETEGDPDRIEDAKATAAARQAREAEGMRKLYQLVERTIPTRPAISPSWLAENRHRDLGIPRRAMASLIETALRAGVLKLGERTDRGATLVLGKAPPA